MIKQLACKLCQGREFIINPKTGVKHCAYCGLHKPKRAAKTKGNTDGNSN